MSDLKTPVLAKDVIHRGDCIEVLKSLPDASVDMVFADPPYALGSAEVEQVLSLLVAQGWLVRGSLLVLERSTRSVEPAWPEGLVRERSKDYGETVLWYVLADS